MTVDARTNTSLDSADKPRRRRKGRALYTPPKYEREKDLSFTVALEDTRRRSGAYKFPLDKNAWQEGGLIDTCTLLFFLFLFLLLCLARPFIPSLPSAMSFSPPVSLIFPCAVDYLCSFPCLSVCNSFSVSFLLLISVHLCVCLSLVKYWPQHFSVQRAPWSFSCKALVLLGICTRVSISLSPGVLSLPTSTSAGFPVSPLTTTFSSILCTAWLPLFCCTDRVFLSTLSHVARMASRAVRLALVGAVSSKPTSSTSSSDCLCRSLSFALSMS